MNARISEIADKLRARVIEEEKKPGYNPFDDDLYYVLYKLEIAYNTLETIYQGEAAKAGLGPFMDTLRSE